MTALQQQGAAAKAATYALATASTAVKNAALEAMAQALIQGQEDWLAANAQDVAAAREAGMRPAMLDRLTLTPERIAGIVDGVRQVAALPDPIGRVDRMETRPNGLIIGRRRVPLGVIAIIFEARPNVTVDAAALCLKSGNVCILRGGKEAIRSNRCAAELMRGALVQAGLPADCISLVQDTSHETANELMHLDGYVDVLIPRGGAGLIRAVAKEASVPVIRTGEGVCHVYVDGQAVGAKNVGQDFTDPRFMRCRPSAYQYNTYTVDEEGNKFYNDGSEYAGVASGSNNYGASNPALAERVQGDIDEFLAEHPDLTVEDIPTDLVTASGSGLDPHISPASAAVQIPQLAENTGLTEEQLEQFVADNTTGKVLGIFGEETVNVLGVNLDIAEALGLIGGVD